MNENGTQLSPARLDQMIEFAMSHAQEKKKIFVWTWARICFGVSCLAMAASVIGALWLTPVVAPKKPTSLAKYDSEISDFMMLETFEDLS